MSDPVYSTRSAFDAGLVVNAPTMNKTDINGYLQDRSFATMFPPVCIKYHWDAEEVAKKYILPADTRVPLPVDPRPLVKNCTQYLTTTPASVYPASDRAARSALGLTTQPGGSARNGVPYEVYANNLGVESELYLDHPQNKCDENKFIPAPDSDLYTNRHAPPQKASDSFTELSRALATIVPAGPYACRSQQDERNWEKSPRLFNNPTREDRIPGAAARWTEGPLGKKAARTGKVAVQPRVWPTNSVVFYVGRGDGGAGLIALCQGMRRRGLEVTIFSPLKSQVVEGIDYQHVSEFVPNDVYSCIVLWNTSELLANFQYRPYTKALLLCLEDTGDKEAVCAPGVKEFVDKIVVRSAFHRSLYDCFSWKKFEIIPAGLPVELFTDIENRNLSRERFRVLVTEYTMELIGFVQHAWTRIRTTYPGAELHVWSSAGDAKEKVYPALIGSSRGLGIVLHGSTSMNEMVRERFRSSIHVVLDDHDKIACESARMSALAGCIPIMPNRGVYTELPGINIDGALKNEKTMIDYAQAISSLFRDGADEIRRKVQMDEGLKGMNATADRWLTVIRGLQSTAKPFSIGEFNSLFN